MSHPVRLKPKTSRHWKFTADHWWKWQEKRKPDAKTLERRSNIETFKLKLP